MHISGSSSKGYSGELSSLDAALSSWKFQGSGCSEVSDALSFVAALGLERFHAVPQPLRR